MTTTRRRAAALILALGAGLATGAAAGDAAPKEFRIGYQKVGVVVVARRQGVIETRLAPQGVAVRWVEFQAGPPLLEALNAGSIDFGFAGDTPPIFAQAAGNDLVYVGASVLSGDGEAVVVKAGSPIRTVADLKGRAVAVARGTSSHNLLVTALEKAGLAFSDIRPAYLLPSDAGPAFTNGSVDAWVIWDPYLALAQAHDDTRVLTTSRQIHAVSDFFLARRDFADRYPGVVTATVAALADSAAWAEAHRDQVAQALSSVTGVPYPIETTVAARSEFGVGPVTDALLAKQQSTADRFHRLGLLPRPIQVRDAVWTPRT
ncbi:aliphatic sulfonate ABC transporter substrate-binding protein [Methylobacterium sp. NMS14P]|uniref:aliphatic sulfonate ABC transporter substrate-binding protein n=1 Tax=Methylobacterium sp. NMS14P TaxID=2894310 RepID=UPI00235914A9|nr:aliphatic sulfonate ABC transporter substrate-binding protein [Methylobacterium sp. NMS14P]WCS23833.1 aliphatic sulfonate ABC transporter substrate-binding protein [Methylobacterium sp. NMS14P]